MTVSTTAAVFPAIGPRPVVAQFDGGDVTSDAGLALLAAADRRLGVTAALVGALSDRRQAAKVEHPAVEVIQARVYAIAQGYEDGNDLDRLRDDPGLKTVCGQRPVSGAPLCSQPTVSRFEHARTATDLVRMGWALVDLVIAQLPADAADLVIDVDPYDDPCHGQQQLSLFNGHYDTRCYLPLAACVTGPDGVKWPLGVLLRPGNAKATLGLFTVLRGLVRRLRAQCPQARLILRADSAFGVNDVLRWCDTLDLLPLLGLRRNGKVQEESLATQMDACLKYRWAGDGCREFGAFTYQANSWARAYPVIVKAEITQGDLNPRFVISGVAGTPEAIYARYCGRGDAENVWKEFKLDLAGGRTSCTTFLANQARLLWHTAALLLCLAIRQAATGTVWATATVTTLRTRLFKIAAKVVETCRKIWWHLPTSCPVQADWCRIAAALT
jgi:hypothetical protein